MKKVSQKTCIKSSWFATLPPLNLDHSNKQANKQFMQNLPPVSIKPSFPQSSEAIFRSKVHKLDLGIQIVLEEQILSYHQALCSFCSCISVYCIIVFFLSDTLLSYHFHIKSLMFLIKQIACIILVILCSETEGVILGGYQMYSWASQ